MAQKKSTRHTEKKTRSTAGTTRKKTVRTDGKARTQPPDDADATHTRQGSDRGAQKEEERESAAAAATRTVEELLGKSDQIGSILTKGLGLAEAGISLGLNLLNRVGSMTQENLIDRFTAPFTAQPQSAQRESTRQEDAAQHSSQDQAGPAPEVMFISNRLPVLPGQECRIPFSINNDSYTSQKKVKLHCEGFIGERTATRFGAAAVSIHPATKTIEPMDFEKFLLTGTIPEGLPPDMYQGWIVVTADNNLRIPVRIIVSESL